MNFPEPMQSRSRWADGVMLGLIFAFGLTLRLAYIAITPGDPREGEQDPHYYALIARNLLEGRGFIELQARAYRPPAFPALLALISAIFGPSFSAAQAVMAVCGALHPVLLALWARALATPRVGYFAAWLAAIHPQFLRYPQTLYAEPFYFFILAAAMWLLLRGLRISSLPQVALSGAVFGIGALTREVTLMMPLFLGLWFWFNRPDKKEAARHRWQGARSTRMWCIFSLSMAAVVLPWTARNYVLFKSLVPISTNSGINFYIGNNPDANLTPDFSDPNFWKLAPGVDWRDGAGELEAHRRGLREGLHYIAAHPARSAQKSVQRAALLWTPPLGGLDGTSRSTVLLRAFWLAFTLMTWGFALYGLWRTRSAWRMLALPLLVIIGFSLPYVLTYVDARYRLPMESFLLFYSALGLDALWQWRGAFARRSKPQTRIKAAGYGRQQA